ncbi:unnamed protein product [Polarella glacialis]|uniref:Uncharacterized protein n=1 Tax=Polarella glacialis TaxID=89957 RepID=A0A813KVT4_POLGL|nr:unnamed protein product [Polarella glacialis]
MLRSQLLEVVGIVSSRDLSYNSNSNNNNNKQTNKQASNKKASKSVHHRGRLSARSWAKVDCARSTSCGRVPCLTTVLRVAPTIICDCKAILANCAHQQRSPRQP